MRGDSHVIVAEDARIAVRKLDALNLQHQLCETLLEDFGQAMAILISQHISRVRGQNLSTIANEHSLINILEGDSSREAFGHLIVESVLRFLREPVLQQSRYMRGDSHVIRTNDLRIAVRKLDALDL